MPGEDYNRAFLVVRQTEVTAPAVQAVPLPALPTTPVCDARIRWRTPRN